MRVIADIEDIIDLQDGDMSGSMFSSSSGESWAKGRNVLPGVCVGASNTQELYSPVSEDSCSLPLNQEGLQRAMGGVEEVRGMEDGFRGNEVLDDCKSGELPIWASTLQQRKGTPARQVILSRQPHQAQLPSILSLCHGPTNPKIGEMTHRAAVHPDSCNHKRKEGCQTKNYDTCSERPT